MSGPTKAQLQQKLSLLEEVAAGEKLQSRHLEMQLAEASSTLDRQLAEPGWQLLAQQSVELINRRSIMDMADACRVMAAVNPMAHRGLSLRSAYVWGLGVQIQAKQDEVNAVIQRFLDDPQNQATFASTQAREERERALGTEGNVFLALMTNVDTGRVIVRPVPSAQITEIISSPEDRYTPWFYRRQWTEGTETKEILYPDIYYTPVQKPPTYSNTVIQWNAPIRHVRVNTPEGGQWGLPDLFPAMDWIREYRIFLSDWAKLVRSLSRLAWRQSAPGGSKAKAAEQWRVNQENVGGVGLVAPGGTLEAIPKSGATIDSDSGRPLAAMAAAGIDVPVTMLLGDPGVTGARATAETLDKPLELTIRMRRELWTSAMRDIFNYVLLCAVNAKRGPQRLQGRVQRDDYTDTLQIVVAKDLNLTVDIDWPELDSDEMTAVVDAWIKADGTGYIPPATVLRELLKALKVDDIDEIMDTITDNEGNLILPEQSAGQAAVDAFNRGEDPAGVV